MKIQLQRMNSAFKFEAKSEQGLTITMDASESIGGENLGMRPMEVLASSLAGCSSIDILNILYNIIGGVLLNYIGGTLRYIYGSVWRTIFNKPKFTFKEYINGPNKKTSTMNWSAAASRGRWNRAR